EWARGEHFILTILFTLFFVVHIVQVIFAGWNNLRGMVTGLDVLPTANELILQPTAILKEIDSPKTLGPVIQMQNEKSANDLSLKEYEPDGSSNNDDKVNEALPGEDDD
ncbi:MAG: cytochrome b/b6 domain-containing protein, partial [Bacteroidota bacterium]|nr:cytochrome b/b6 domain-containing protein [Bacteroidota bacterium]